MAKTTQTRRSFIMKAIISIFQGLNKVVTHSLRFLSILFKINATCFE